MNCVWIAVLAFLLGGIVLPPLGFAFLVWLANAVQPGE